MGLRDQFVSAIKYAFVTVTTTAIMGVLVSTPVIGVFFGNPWVGSIFKKIISDVLGKAAEQAEVAAFFQYIDTRTNGQGIAWSEEAIKNWQVQNSNVSKEEKQRAEDAFFAKHKAFVKFNS